MRCDKQPFTALWNAKVHSIQQAPANAVTENSEPLNDLFEVLLVLIQHSSNVFKEREFWFELFNDREKRGKPISAVVVPLLHPVNAEWLAGWPCHHNFSRFTDLVISPKLRLLASAMKVFSISFTTVEVYLVSNRSEAGRLKSKCQSATARK
jgi:hypothetical protein